MVYKIRFHVTITNIILILLVKFCIFSTIVNPTESKDVKLGYTEHERQIIPKFRRLVQNDVIEEYMLHDAYLVRWIRSTNYNLEKARGKFLNHIQWKLELKDSNYLDNTGNYSRVLPYRITQSKDGRPVLTGYLGLWDIRKAELLSKRKNPFTRHMIRLFDEISFAVIESSNNGNPNVTNAVEVFDMSGYSVRTHACAVCLADILKSAEIWEVQYPRLFGDILLINTPRIFESLLTLIKSALGDYYKNTIKVYGLNKADWEGPVTDLIGRNTLTQGLSGSED